MNEVYVNSRRASLAEPHRNAATAAGVWGYQFLAARVRGEYRILAGCRNLSVAEARNHWGPDGPSDRPDCRALVEKLAADADVEEVCFDWDLDEKITIVAGLVGEWRSRRAR